MVYTQIVLTKEKTKKWCLCPSGGIGRRTGLKILRVLKLVPVQVRPWAPFIIFFKNILYVFGRLAQLVRAPALQAGGRRFESYIAHHLPT